MHVVQSIVGAAFENELRSANVLARNELIKEDIHIKYVKESNKTYVFQ